VFPNTQPIGQEAGGSDEEREPARRDHRNRRRYQYGSLPDKARPMVYYPQAHLSFGFGTLVE
jgi:hypothetical protein